MKLENILDLRNLYLMIEKKYISVRNHPVLPLRILNYTHTCQFDKMWNNETEQCRGLIIDSSGNVIARPFRKFYNYEQDFPLGKIPNESFDAYAKEDGSLGIMYFDHDGQFSLATRGSFDSEQAIEGTKILREKYGDWLRDRYHLIEGKTVLFEIIYPENRIVIDYKGLRDVIMLTVIDNVTGKDTSLNCKVPWNSVSKYDGVKDIAQIKALNTDNEEGFVLLFESGYRCKVKFDEYMRLHRILTGLNEKDIWESLSLGKDPVAEFSEKCPDEFYAWLRATKQKFVDKFNDIQKIIESYKMTLSNQNLVSRKDIAIWIQLNVPSEYRTFLFASLDGRDASDKIWKLFMPVGPFKSFKIDEP